MPTRTPRRGTSIPTTASLRSGWRTARYLNAAQIRDSAAYTRYTYQFAYSNNLAYRLDYYQATKGCRTAAESGKAIATYLRWL